MRGGGTLDDKADEQAPGTVGNMDIFTRTPSSVITLAVGRWCWQGERRG